MKRLAPTLQNGYGIKFENGGQTAFRITLFALLEALNIVPPKIPTGLINVEGMPFPVAYKTLIATAEEYFQKQPELQAAFLRDRDRHQRAYADAEALSLYEGCITSILNRPIDISVALASYLARDYLFKYPFKTEDLLSHMPAFAVMFFLDDPPLAPASRFRLTMRLYDPIRQNVEAAFPNKAIAKALRIKTDRDFLDTDIVQDVTFGFPYQGTRHRVVALTFDDAEAVSIRIRLHRQAGFTLAKNMAGLAASDPKVAADISSFLAHPGGCVVQSDKDGNVIRFVDASMLRN